MVILLDRNKRNLPQGNTENVRQTYTRMWKPLPFTDVFHTHRKNSFKSTKTKTHNLITKWLPKGNYFTKETCKWPRHTQGRVPRIHHTSQHLSPSNQLTHRRRGNTRHQPALSSRTLLLMGHRHVPPLTPCSSKATQYDACGSAGSLCTNRSTHRRKNKPCCAHTLGLRQQGRTSTATQGKQVHCAHPALKGWLNMKRRTSQSHRWWKSRPWLPLGDVRWESVGGRKHGKVPFLHPGGGSKNVFAEWKIWKISWK